MFENGSGRCCMFACVHVCSPMFVFVCVCLLLCFSVCVHARVCVFFMCVHVCIRFCDIKGDKVESQEDGIGAGGEEMKGKETREKERD